MPNSIRTSSALKQNIPKRNFKQPSGLHAKMAMPFHTLYINVCNLNLISLNCAFSTKVTCAFKLCLWETKIR